ncbi:helix-turn-helix transcriptional regulator [Glaciihabitans sp. GrIS 2.15]|uniref:helix-turn-helix transcriptional regulator n=1 Tax=Glaciihabitans sp. GrIS 2.15 TaxID=3071710 RepID=UPI002DFC187C|nr:transcriptional regulator with XRE-family HTH domain [Glaciihabitans sp. GrIS 2.15]
MSPRPARLAPHQLCVGWPDSPSDDNSAEVARRFALNVRAEMGGRSIREFARDTGLDRATITGIVNGGTWADLQSIARLELVVGKTLWPSFAGRAKQGSFER